MLSPRVGFVLRVIKTFSKVPGHSTAGFCFSSGLEWNWEGVADGPEVVASSAFGEVRGCRGSQLWMCHRSASPRGQRPPTPTPTQREGAGLGVAPGAQPPRDLPLGGTHRFLYPFSPQKVTDGVSSQSYDFMEDLASPLIPLSLYWFIYLIRTQRPVF